MICMLKVEMMIVSMRHWLHRRILTDFRIKNGKCVNNLLEQQKEPNKYEIKNKKTVDKFERSGYNRIKERLKTENT